MLLIFTVMHVECWTLALSTWDGVRDTSSRGIVPKLLWIREHPVQGVDMVPMRSCTPPRFREELQGACLMSLFVYLKSMCYAAMFRRCSTSLNNFYSRSHAR
jgi:hypothetical protein